MNSIKIIFSRFKGYLKDYIPQFCIAVLGMIMAAIGTAGSAYLIKDVLDEIFISKNEAYNSDYTAIQARRCSQ